MFLLFLVISLVVMIFIYGNIQQDGLVLSIHRNTVNTTQRRLKHNKTITSKEMSQKLPPPGRLNFTTYHEHKGNITDKWTVQDSGGVKEKVLLNTKKSFQGNKKITVIPSFSQETKSTFPSLYKGNITDKWTVQDTGGVKEKVLWNTKNSFQENKNITVIPSFSQGTKSTFPSLQTITTINHRNNPSDRSIKSKINSSTNKKTDFTTTVTREKSPKYQIQMTTPKINRFTSIQFSTFGKKITFYDESFTETPETKPTTTENLEKLENDLFAALDELAKKYSKETM